MKPRVYIESSVVSYLTARQNFVGEILDAMSPTGATA
jgi:hypothetical protein